MTIRIRNLCHALYAGIVAIAVSDQAIADEIKLRLLEATGIHAHVFSCD